MTLAKRIIPCLDVKDGRVVKGIHFVKLKDAGNPVELASRYRDEGADELVFLDITASPEKRKIIKNIVRSVARELDIPFTVGGGIRSADDAREILSNGADKVAINTKAIENPSLVTEIADRFGQQCCVVAIDAKRAGGNDSQSSKNGKQFEIYSYGARKATGIDALEWAKRVEGLGAGELLVTSIDRDGTQRGYDIELTRSICNSVNIPVIASGGCGKLEHFTEVFQAANADAALAASIFHYQEYSVPNVKSYLKEKGILVRI